MADVPTAKRFSADALGMAASEEPGALGPHPTVPFNILYYYMIDHDLVSFTVLTGPIAESDPVVDELARRG